MNAESADMDRISADGLYRLLLSGYGEPRWWSDDPFMVMVQAILVQNTAWRNVEKATAIIGNMMTPVKLYHLDGEELESLIRPCGFQKAKARTIKGIIEWFRTYAYDAAEAARNTVADLRRELLSIKGIGEETADAILVYALHKPSFIIDAYTRRLLGRLGYGFKDDGEIRSFVEEGLQRDARLFGYLHWLILDHSIQSCRKTPRCASCPIAAHCRHASIALTSGSSDSRSMKSTTEP